MFLNIYLFLSNILFISFCMIYIRTLNLYTEIDKINILKNKIKKEKNTVKKSKKSQLDYIKNNHQVRDIEFKLIGWKALSLMVAIVMALNIIGIEPFIIFGVKLRYSIILIVLIINWIFSRFIQKLGVKT